LEGSGGAVGGMNGESLYTVHAIVNSGQIGRSVISPARCGLRRSDLPFKREVDEVSLDVIGGQPHF